MGAGEVSGNNIDIPKKTGLWSTVSISRILRNEQYTGTMVYGKTKTKEISKRSKRQEPKDSWKRIENHHDAIINSELFNKTQELLLAKY